MRSGHGRRATLILASFFASAVWGAEPEVVTNSIGMKLVSIPSEEFFMGAEEDREDTLSQYPYCNPKWLDVESPRHRVRITKAFYLGQYEVTLGEFLQFYHDAKYQLDCELDGKPNWGYENDKFIESTRFRPWDPRAWKAENDQPVVYVSWNDAVAFCKWLSKKEGKTYRLPTEAEWEYACRAGSSSRYSFGNDPEELIRFANGPDANCKTIFPNATKVTFDKSGEGIDENSPFPFLLGNDGYAWISPVGKFHPNNFGLYDMHGNVWEWCSDWYGKDYYANSPVDDPQGPSDGSSRVLRGGGFGGTPVLLRCAHRSVVGTEARSYYFGFRVVCAP